MNLLNFFSIKQKLAILLFLLLSAVSYVAISSINDAQLHEQNNAKIKIAQQQHLIVEQFINALFWTKQQITITGENTDYRAVKKNQALFENNLNSMLNGGKSYLDLSMNSSIHLDAIINDLIKQELTDSQVLWSDLQRSGNNLSLQAISIDQLDTFHHLANKLHKKLSNIVSLLTEQRDQIDKQDQITLQLTLLFILIMGVGFSWLVAQNITQPLDTISKATSRIRLGDLQSYPIKNNHHDELGTLFYQADEMRIVLSELILTIQQHIKQITHSSSQLNQLSNEMNALHHLQYTLHENISTQLKVLDEQNQQQCKLLTQHFNFNINFNFKKQQDFDSYLQQQRLQINSINETVNQSLQLLNEGNDKADANLLFIQDLNKVSQQLELLAHEYKTDEKENRARKGNDKRLYPRINNQLKVTFQQAENTVHGVSQHLSLSGLQLKSMQSVQFNSNSPITFTIQQPIATVTHDTQDIVLQGDLVHYKQDNDSFYYSVQFHPLDEQQKMKLQNMFDYFEKKSEFKSELQSSMK